MEDESGVIKVTPEKMYETADHLFQDVTVELRELFKKCFQTRKGSPWEDTPAKREILLRYMKKLTPEEKAEISEGQFDSWKMPLLCTILRNLKGTSGNDITLQYSATVEIKHLYNSVYSKEEKRMEEKEFDQIIKHLELFLFALEFEPAFIIETIDKHLDLLFVAHQSQIESTYLKEGNQYRKEGLFSKAVEFFTQVLESKGKEVSDDVKVTIYKARFSALREQQVDEKKVFGKENYWLVRDAVRDAHTIVNLDGAYGQATKYLTLYYKSMNDPYRALHHYTNSVNFELFNIFPTMKDIVYVISQKMEKGPPYYFLTKGCQLLQTLLQTSVIAASDPCENQVKYGEMAKQLQDAVTCFRQASMFDVDIGDFAYYTCYVILYSKMVSGDATKDTRRTSMIEAIDYLKEVALEKTQPHIFGDKYSKAVNNRIGYAQLILGFLAETGCCTKKDIVEAEKWYRSASTRHNICAASFNLGLLYLDGVEGKVLKNSHLARMHLFQAYSGGHPLASPIMTSLYLKELEISRACDHFKIIYKTSKKHEIVDDFGDWFLIRFTLARDRDHCEVELKRLEEILWKKYEVLNGLSIKGLTLSERVKRAELLGFQNNLTEILERVEFTFKLAPPCYDEQVENLERIETSFSKRINEARKHINKVYEILQRFRLLSNVNAGIIMETLYCYFMVSSSIKFGLRLLSDVDKQTLTRITDTLRNLYLDAATREHNDMPEQEMKAGILYLIFKSELGPTSIDYWEEELEEETELVETALENFSDCILYYIWVGEVMPRNTPEKAVFVGKVLEDGVRKFPENLTLLFLHASYNFNVYCKNTDECSQQVSPSHGKAHDGIASKAVRNFQKFLDKAPIDHPFHPSAAYNLSFMFIRLLGTISCRDRADSFYSTVNYKTIEKYYKIGVESETLQFSHLMLGLETQHLRLQIEVYLERGDRSLNEMLSYFIKKNLGVTKKEQSWQNLFPKNYLCDPLREYFIIGVRYRLKVLNNKRSTTQVDRKFIFEVKNQKDFFSQYSTSKASSHLLNLNGGITTFAPNVLEGQLNLTVIEDVVYDPRFAYFLCEDQEGNAIHVGVDHGATVFKSREVIKLECGATVTIINPHYFQLGAGDDRCIRVGTEPQCQMIVTGRVKDMCRFCGNADAKKQCGKCKRPYCSENCQKKDFRILKHKYICRDG